MTEEVETHDGNDNEEIDEEETTSDASLGLRPVSPDGEPASPEGEAIENDPEKENETTEEKDESKEKEDEPTEKEDTEEETTREEEQPTADEQPEEEPLPFDQSAILDGVIVRVQADAGVFPNDAVLSVTRVLLYEQNQADAAVEEVREEGQNVAARYTFDIKILDADGNELQPADGAQVHVSFSLETVADENLETAVYHIEEEIGGMSAERLEADVTDDTITAVSDGFSIYTVEFTYKTLQYVLTGGESVALTDVLAVLNLVGEVSAAEVSAPELFSVTQDETGAWTIHSHMAFGSVEWMTVIIDGIEYKITVTDYADAGYISYVDGGGNDLGEMDCLLLKSNDEGETWSTG